MIRLVGIFVALAILVLIPFLIWGDGFEHRLGLAGAIDWLRRYGGWAWAAGVLLLVSDLFLPIPATAVMAALGYEASGNTASVFDAAYAFCAELGIEMKLSGLGVPESDLDAMADDAFAIRRLLDNNPRDLTRADIRSIYAAAF